MGDYKLCNDGEFVPVTYPCPPPYSGPYYFYPYDTLPLPPEEGNTGYAASPSRGGAAISSGAVAAIIIVVGFIFFVLCLIAVKFRSRFILGSIVRVSSRNGRHTFDQHTGELLVNSGDMQLVNIVGSGLEQKLVNLLLVCEYMGLMKEGKERHECAVCLSFFEEKEIVRVLPKCHHIFHLPCIDKWFESHANCPLCRERITLQTFQFSSNSDKDDDPQLLHPADSHPDLALDLRNVNGNLSNRHVDDQTVNPPPSRDACVQITDDQEDERPTCDLQDPNRHQNILLAVALATSINHPQYQNAVQHLTQAAGGSSIADHQNSTGFRLGFWGDCDQNGLPTLAVAAEAMKYDPGAELKGGENACNEAAMNACVGDGSQYAGHVICGRRSIDDHPVLSAVSDGSNGTADDHRRAKDFSCNNESFGAAANDEVAQSQRESNKTGILMKERSSEQAHNAGQIEDDKEAAMTSAAGAQENSRGDVAWSMCSSAHASRRAFSVLKKSVSTSCLNEWDAKATHPFQGTTYTRGTL